MDTAVKKKTGFRLPVRYAVLAGAAAVIIAAYYICTQFSSFVLFWSGHVSLPVRQILGAVFSVLPFSVMELIYTVAGALLIAFIVLTILAAIRKKSFLPVLRRAGILALTAAYIFASYLWLFGIDYLAPGFAQKNGLKNGAVSTEDLIAVTVLFAQKANEFAPAVERDENGVCIFDTDEILDLSIHVYENISDEFPSLGIRFYRPKEMMYSSVMSRMGFTGVYFPFTGESNLNTVSPDVTRPCTAAHELAHQSGVTSEAEANFVGILGCVTSGLSDYEYSGWFSGLMHLMNALYTADYETWTLIASALSDEVRTDWNANSQYWRSMRSGVTEASEAVYSTYLKVNGQELGIRSYGACVNLLVEYFAR